MKRVWCAAAAVLVLAGCSSSDGHGPKHSTSVRLSKSVPPPATSARLSVIPVGPSTSSAPPADPAARKAAAALVTSQDLVGGAFTELPYSAIPLPQPCAAASTPPVLTRLPANTHVGRQFTLASPQALLTEDVFVFAEPARASQFVNAITDGLQCSSGVVRLADGSTQQVTVDGPAALTSVIGVKGMTVAGWTMQNGQLSTTFTIAYSKQVVVALGFLAPSTSDLSRAPDGPTIARTALDKVRAARLGR